MVKLACHWSCGKREPDRIPFCSTALAVQIYLQMDRLDLARKEVAHTKSWAEDALLLQLMEAWVDLRVVRFNSEIN